jgi:WD40 repeat protein
VFPVSRIGSVYDIITFPNKTFICVCDDEIGNSQVTAWKTDLLKPTAIYKGHDELEVNCIEHLPPKNNQNRFITSGCDGSLCVWTVGNLTPNRTIEVHHDCFNAIATLPSGEVVVATKKADDLFLWSTDPETRPVPAGSENMITGDDIVDGNEMVNLVRQTDPKVLTNYNAGTFFKNSEDMRALTVHPVSRRALDPGNFHPYLARVEPTAVAKPVTTTRRRRRRQRRNRTRTRRM